MVNFRRTFRFPAAACVLLGLAVLQATWSRAGEIPVISRPVQAPAVEVIKNFRPQLGALWSMGLWPWQIARKAALPFFKSAWSWGHAEMRAETQPGGSKQKSVTAPALFL